MLKSVKVSGIYPWVCLNQIIYKNPSNLNIYDYQVSLFFKDGSITLLSINIISMLEKIVKNLYQLFGEELPIKMEIETLDFKPLSKQKLYFSNLFGSHCLAMDLPINEQIYNKLLTIQNNASEYGLTIDIQYIKPDTKYITPILNSIKDLRKIYKLSVIGPEINDLFVYLSQVINNNINTLKIISIEQLTSFQEIDIFYQALLKSKITTLIFKDINFPKSFNDPFTEFMKQSVVVSLSFNNCKFHENTFKQFQDNLYAFENLVSFQLYNVDFLKNKEIFQDFFKFITLTKLSDLKLVNIDIDVSCIFNILDSNSIPLITLDLSENRCTDFTGKYRLPVTLTELNVSNIQWDANSLTNLLLYQKYNNCIFLNVSSILGSTYIDMIYLKPSSSALCIGKLSWNNNILNSLFLEFISSLENLESLEINGCEFVNNPSDPIISKFVTYFSSCKLKEISMCGNETRTYKNKIQEFFASFSTMTTLETLLIGYNDIGDKGLENLVNICQRNQSIRKIDFNGSNLQNPNSFIQCCNKLSQLNNIECVSRCEQDIQQLYHNAQKYNVAPSKIDEAWNKLQEKVEWNKSYHKKEIKDNETQKTDDNMQKVQITKQTASWDIEIPVPYNREPSEWDVLIREFSLENLTGFPPDEPDALMSL